MTPGSSMNTTVSDNSIARPTAAERDWIGIATLAAAALAAIAYHWNGLVSLGAAWSTAEYSHGPLIPVLSFVLFLKHLKVVEAYHATERSRYAGIALVAFAMLIGAVGNIARIPDIVTYGLILWTFGLVLTAFGYHRGILFWAAVVHLIFMLPLPNFIYWKLSITLQFISAEIGVAIVRMFDIPVYLDGNIIDLGAYKLDVAEACSGLRYLFPIMSFSYIFCMLYNGPVWHKAVLLISAAPLTMAMNSVRIGIIGVLVNSYGIEHAEGFLHFFEGWVIFLSCIALLFLLTRVLQFINRDKRPMLEVLELDFDGMGRQLRRVLNIRRSMGMAAVAGLTAIGAAATHLAPAPPAAAVSREPLVLFPQNIGGWASSRPKRLDANIENVLAADDYFSASFSNFDVSAAQVDMFVAWYRSQTDGAGIHSPEVCIPAGGWEMSKISPIDITVKTTSGETIPMSVNRATIRKGYNTQLVYYWFEQRGRKLNSDYLAKALTVWDSMTIGRSDGALVRLVTPIIEGEPESAAAERLEAFMSEMMPILPKFVPD